MAIYTSRRFNQEVSDAKRAAADGPVFITDRGRPAHVLMTIEEYRRLTDKTPAAGRTLADMLAFDGESDIAFDPPRSREIVAPPALD